MIDAKGLTKGKSKAVQDFIAVFANVSPQGSPSKAFEQIIKRTAYLQHVKDTYDPQDAQARMENIKELLHAIQHFESTSINTI